MSLQDDGADLRGTLLPHQPLTETQLKRALSLFDSLSIPQPWYAEKPSFLSEAEKLGMVRIINPPETLKPAQDFTTLLSEYKNWARHHQDARFRAFLMASPEAGKDATWDIRGMVRRGRKDATPSGENRALGWHLLLHLALEVERGEQSVASMLRVINEAASPLKGAVEEEGGSDTLKGLPGLESAPILDEQRLLQVLRAWFCLFGEQLQKDEPLVTMSSRWMGYISETWEEVADGRLKAAESSITVKAPDLSQCRLDELYGLRKELFSNPAVNRLKRAVRGFCHDPLRFYAQLQKISEGTDAPPVPGLNHGTMKLRVRHLAPGSTGRPERGFWGYLMGKTMTCIEGELRNA
jgi:hypothetical protein